MGYRADNGKFRAEGSREASEKESEWREAERVKQDGGRQASLLNAALAAKMWLPYLAVLQGKLLEHALPVFTAI